MLILEEFEAILERILANDATETDVATLRRSLKQSGKVVQIELQQEKLSLDIEQISGGEIQFGDRTYYGADRAISLLPKTYTLIIPGLVPYGYL